jgi:hypothetical protein
MEPNKGNLLGAIHLLNMIKSFTYTAKKIAGRDAATTMAAGVVSTILTSWVAVGRNLESIGYLRGFGAGSGPTTLLDLVAPVYRLRVPPGDSVDVLRRQVQKLSETCAVLADGLQVWTEKTLSPLIPRAPHNLNDDFAKCESAVQEVINRFLEHLKAANPTAFNKFIGDLIHY